MNKKSKIFNSNILYTFIAILIGFLVGAILLLAIGNDPVVAYSKLFSSVFSKPKYIVYSIVYASPLILTGLSVAFSFRTGVFNIGAEGQFVVGSLAACLCGIFLKLPAPLHVLVCVLAAAAAGIVWGAIVGFLKIKRGINEVLSYIMFNWIAFYLSNYVVNLKSVHRDGGGEATKNILESARMTAPKDIIKLTGCSDANWGIILAVVAALAIWFIMNKTTLGFQLRSVGYSKTAAEYAGISSNKIFLISMSISGALAGLGGAVQTLGMGERISQFATQEQYGFQGITVALIGSSHPIGCIFAGLFYGAMKYGGSKLTMVNVPQEVVNIIMGTIIIFVAITHVFKSLLTKNKGGQNE
ncbi:ABC transporter permease [Butyrivibrio sp. NC3005]|uniref:ABC transporter permease n=1 Tax=Butyrivibrio sp. NC3005 TaxID=1280685 RepID=UPI000401D711|nr:ABC transporter permease [Butyrivibrio sp. NC3005]